MAAKQQQIDISSLGIGELQQLHQQLSAEVNNFASSMVALQQTAARFGAAGQSVEELQGAKQGQHVMLPMTESLYIPGRLENVESVLVEIGTGYFVEKDIDAGVEYCRRKVMLVKDQLEQLSKIIKSRQHALEQISMVLEQKAKAAGAASS